MREICQSGFDEREEETGSSQTGLRGPRRKPYHIPTGRLPSLRLFSTLLAMSQLRPDFPQKGEQMAQACENACLRQLRTRPFALAMRDFGAGDQQNSTGYFTWCAAEVCGRTLKPEPDLLSRA